MSTRIESTRPLRFLTIDVEEYFHIEAAHGHVPRSDWHRMELRAERSVEQLLALCERYNVRGTFFILGDVARRCPMLAPRIADAGHEVACHGNGHDHLSRLDARTFRNDVIKAKHLLEDQTNLRVMGYRAPTFSITDHTAWAVDVLHELGFRYDSSVFPVKHPNYGVHDAPDWPFMVAHGVRGPGLLEVPPLVWRCGSRNVPVAGGGYFRLLPLWFMKRGLAQAAAEGRPAVLYFHPWEFDPEIPRLPLSLLGRVRTYTGLGSSLKRLESILKLPGSWAPLSEHFIQLHALARRDEPFRLAA